MRFLNNFMSCHELYQKQNIDTQAHHMTSRTSIDTPILDTTFKLELNFIEASAEHSHTSPRLRRVTGALAKAEFLLFYFVVALT